LDSIARIATLGDPVRRALFEYVAGERREVGRDEASAAVGIARPLAAFHLDKLAQAGMLIVGYRRLSGRTGPGAGRPAKVYRLTDNSVDVTIPRSNYRLGSAVLAEALARGGADMVETVAVNYGRRLAQDVRGSREENPRKLFVTFLDDIGFEPVSRGDAVELRNNPFAEVSQRQPCIYRSLVVGLLFGACDAFDLQSPEILESIDSHPVVISLPAVRGGQPAVASPAH
jgi:predicted ArsR family transcriptional regulator